MEDIISGVVTGYTNENTFTFVNMGQSSGSQPVSYIYDSNLTNVGVLESKKSYELNTMTVGSPTLTSMGVPDNATITDIKVTVDSSRYYNDTYGHPETRHFYIQAGNTRCSNVGVFNRTYSSYYTDTYNSGSISVKKQTLSNDRVYFGLEFAWIDDSMSWSIKYFHWEITYEVRPAKPSLGARTVTKSCVGVTPVQAIYMGDIKVYE